MMAFERFLWATRLIVLVPVIGSLLLAASAFLLGAADTVEVIRVLLGYVAADGDATHAARNEVVASVVQTIDADLIGAIMLVVALGLYELFIKRLRAAEESEVAERVLTVRTLDDLKDRITRLVLLILIVEFFGVALGLTISSALELLMLGVGILMIAAAMYLASRH